MPKRVTSLWVHLRVNAPARNTASFEELRQQWQAVTTTVSDLMDQKFEPQISRSRNERVQKSAKTLLRSYADNFTHYVDRPISVL